MYNGISTLTYNAAGNMTQDTSLNYNWNAENQLTSVSGSSSESYSYDADGSRASRTAGGITTVYLGPLYEADNDAANTSRRLYQFGGTIVAQRTINSGGNTFIYLHGDHLGSISMTTDGVSGSYVSGQEFDPWGSIRSGDQTAQTKLNYTGQRKDASAAANFCCISVCASAYSTTYHPLLRILHLPPNAASGSIFL